MRRGLRGSSYRAGSFILHPVYVGIVLVGVALWLGLFFALGPSDSAAGIVVALVLVVLGLGLVSLVLLVVWLDVTFTVITRVVERTERQQQEWRACGRGDAWGFFYGAGSAALLALPGVFAFGYMAGGLPWAIYAAAATTCFLALSAALHARR